ncbi:MAG: radical SAM protein [Desulfurococcales archaeon]|nr:radical SAM protein [Desulfurococcales archaeon]
MRVLRGRTRIEDMMSAFRVVGRPWGRPLVRIHRPAPLMGAVFIGVIDRGTNVLQVRPTTLCPLSCIFCSVDAGPKSRWRAAEFDVGDPEWLAEWASRAAAVKGVPVEALIDGVGDPFAYPRLVELVKALKGSPGIRWVAVETHGWALTVELVRRLEEAGLDRVNLSLDTLDPEKARMLTGTPWYDAARVARVAEFIARETSIDLHVTPVWVPGVNDDDVVRIVEWAYRIGAGKKWPPVTIQKMLRHKHGRWPRGAREVNWKTFWEKLRRIERETGLRVTWTMDEWGMRKAPRVPEPLKTGSRVRVLIVAPGWIKGYMTAVTLDGSRIVSVRAPRSTGVRVGDEVTVWIKSSKDGIYLAETA